MGQNLFAPPNVKGWPGGETLDQLHHAARAQAVPRPARAHGRCARPDDDGRRDGTGAARRRWPTAWPPALPAARHRSALARPTSCARERFARQVDRSVRNVRFDAAEWIARRDGASGPARQQSAQALLLPLPPVTANAPAAIRRRAGVRARDAARSRLPAQVNRREGRPWIAAASCMPPPRCRWPVRCRPRSRRWPCGRLRRAGRGELPQAARAGRAEGRQRRAQHARALRGRRVLRAASAHRDPPRPGGAARRPRRAASRARAAAARSGARGNSPFCRASATAIPTSRTSARSRSGTRRAAARTCLQEGWLTRAFATAPTPSTFAADGVIVGANELGPLAGGGTRAIALADTEQFLRRAKLAQPPAAARNKALAHMLKVEGDIVQAAAHLDGRHAFRTEFPAGGFGNAVQDRVPHRRQSVRRGGGARDAVGLRHARAASRPRRRACWANSRPGCSR